MFSLRNVGRFCLGLSLVLVGLTPQAAVADDQGWVLTQRSANFGDMYVYVSPTGFKCHNPKAGVCFMTKAPDWNVVFYNEKTKLYYEAPFARWSKEVEAQISNARTKAMAAGRWSRATEANIAGLKASGYGMQPSKTTSDLKNAKYFVADQIKVPPVIASMLAKVYGLPPMQNVPLRLNYSTTDGAAVSALDTYYAKACAIPSTYYNQPQGYRVAKSQAEVMIDDETKQMLNDLASEAPAINNNSSVAPVPAAQPRQAQAQPGASASGGSINIGGYSLDKDKVKNAIQAWKNQQQQGR